MKITSLNLLTMKIELPLTAPCISLNEFNSGLKGLEVNFIRKRKKIQGREAINLSSTAVGRRKLKKMTKSYGILVACIEVSYMVDN